MATTAVAGISVGSATAAAAAAAATGSATAATGSATAAAAAAGSAPTSAHHNRPPLDAVTRNASCSCSTSRACCQ